MQRGIAAENCGCAFLLDQGPVFIVEFFVDPKTELWKTNKPPAVLVVEVASAYSIKPPVL